MKNPLAFYTSEKLLFEKRLFNTKKQLTFSSSLRLLVFSLISFGIYFFFGNGKAVLFIILIGISVFLYLVSKHTDLQYFKRKLEALIKINNLEISVLNKDKNELYTGSIYKNNLHAYSHDIDLFGEGSFFQYINRTSIQSGEQFLARRLTYSTINQIEEKQISLKELARKPKWRQNFSAIASLVTIETKASNIVNWVQNHQTTLPKFTSFLPKIYFSLSILLFVLLYFDYVTFSVLLGWFFLGLGISSLVLKKVNTIYQNANQAKETFKQYHQLLLQIEKEQFSASILINKQQQIQTETKKASVLFNDFSKVLDALNQRNNMLFGIFGNAFALWDMQQAHKIELWIKNHKHQVEKWFDVIAYFDATNSLANYIFNHPKHTFPILEENNSSIITAKQLGHPLLNENKRVANDFNISDKEFFIITGANMAGKSTFLRTVSLSIVMANIGLPVCSEAFTYSPIHLITSMRTSDSLSDDESYFFSELKRLKFIIDTINPKRTKEKYFIILDEILKGTNSKDKAIGSRKFVEKLVKSNATGIIATHDLSLCEISEELTQVKNYYFDAIIKNNELFFDYSFKKGVCQNMNASFLLEKMKII